MKLALGLALGLAACGPHARDDRVIVPGQRVGAIIRTTGLADLQRIYGRANVVVTAVDVGEGETAPGAVVFPDDSLRRVEVGWHDSTARVPRFVVVRGTRSAWHTDAGVTLGTGLPRLTQLNGRAFVLLGFGWDYAGTVVSWNDGALGANDSSHTRFIVRLAPTVAGADSLQRSALGDREYRSDQAGMAALAPAVYELLTMFE